jgi:purine-nucleoside phosphorylase
MGLYEEIQEAVAEIKKRTELKPRFAIVLGTGLGKLAQEIETDAVIDYPDIPHFVKSTVETHAGHLLLGKIEGQPVVAMSGRFHMYEGHNTKEITFPVRVMRALGAEFLLISNVSGGMNPQFAPGDLMLLDDHINLLGENPLVGHNDERLGLRYPDMSAPYDRELIELAKQIILEEGIRAHTGVYVALTGPCLETRAEYRFLRMIGADVVGMSTVPEVIVGVHAGFRVLGVSVITDECLPDRLKPADINEIIAIANKAEPKKTRLFKRIIAQAK